MMMLADVCMYAVVLSVLGKVELAVTTNLNINFLRKPANTDLVAIGRNHQDWVNAWPCSKFRYTRRMIWYAHVTGTYSIPPQA